MRIAFVHNNYESLGIEYISSYLKKAGHETSLFFEPGLFGSFLMHNRKMHRRFGFADEIVGRVTRAKPDIVAFSVISDNYSWACSLAQRIKSKLDTKVIFGGVHATSVPERILNQEFVDFVIRGEAEESFLELVRALEEGKDHAQIMNLAFRKQGMPVINPLRPPISDLDSLPFPDKDLFFREYRSLIRSSYMITASRGCAFSCTYCVNSVLNLARWRQGLSGTDVGSVKSLGPVAGIAGSERSRCNGRDAVVHIGRRIIITAVEGAVPHRLLCDPATDPRISRESIAHHRAD